MRRVQTQFLVATLILAGLTFAATPGGAQTRKKTAPSPCNDKVFLKLRDKPDSEKTEKEREFYERKQRECNEYQAARTKARKTSSSSKKASSSSPSTASPGAPSKAPVSGKAATPGKAGAPSKAAAPANAALAPSQAGTQSETAKPSEPAPPPNAYQLEPSRQPAPSRSTVFGTPTDDAPQPKLGLTCHAGLAPSTGTMTDYHRTGWSFGGGLAYNLTDRFAIDLFSLGVDHFPLDRKEAAINPPPGGSMTMISMTTGLRGRLTQGHTAVFLAAGTGLFGAAHWDLELPSGETVQGNDRVSLGWNIGAGIDRRLDERRTAFTEIRAIFAATAYENSTYYPVRGGLRFALW